VSKTKIPVIVALAVALGCFYFFDLGRFITLGFVQSQIMTLQEFRETNFPLAAGLYFSAYVAITAFSIPGAVIITLLGGAMFGLFWGTLLASFASSIGATAAFLIARVLLRDWVQSRFGESLKPINEGIEKDGGFYLFSLRMVPLFPFFLVNVAMGLTPIRVRSFYFISQLGMLMGTVVYVNAGVELARINSLSGLVSAPVLVSLALLGVFPLVGRAIVNQMKRKKLTKQYPRPESFDANVVVIGGGSAGLVAAIIGAGSKAKTVLIEKDKMGGDCLNTGCVPSKTLIRSGRIMSYIRRAEEFGLVGSLLLLLFLMLIGYLGLRVALRCRSNQARLVAIGCSTLLVGQSIMNIAVASGAMPTTGLPLPLMSYGGNSLLSSLMIVGLLIRCSLESTGFIGGRGQRRSERKLRRH